MYWPLTGSPAPPDAADAAVPSKIASATSMMITPASRVNLRMCIVSLLFVECVPPDRRRRWLRLVAMVEQGLAGRKRRAGWQRSPWVALDTAALYKLRGALHIV